MGVPRATGGGLSRSGGLRLAAFAAGRDDVRADQDRPGAPAPGDLAGDLEQRRHLGGGAQRRGASAAIRPPGPGGKAPQGDGPAKLRPLAARVEADETLVGGVKPGKRGRGAAGKTAVAGAVEAGRGKGRGRRLGRLRPQAVEDASAESSRIFPRRQRGPPAGVTTEGWQGYAGLARPATTTRRSTSPPAGAMRCRACPRSISSRPRQAVAAGRHHGAVRRKDLQAYLDETSSACTGLRCQFLMLSSCSFLCRVHLGGGSAAAVWRRCSEGSSPSRADHRATSCIRWTRGDPYHDEPCASAARLRGGGPIFNAA